MVDRHNPACEIEVDGGIDAKTIAAGGGRRGERVRRGHRRVRRRRTAARPPAVKELERLAKVR